MIAGPHVRGSIVIAARGHRARQRGMAVVSALFIVALIAALAAVMMNRQSAAIRDTQPSAADRGSSGGVGVIRVILDRPAHARHWFGECQRQKSLSCAATALPWS